MSAPLRAVVKLVLSGSHLVLRGQATAGIAKERTLYLAHLQTPRKDQEQSFESREALRKLVVGKEVVFRILYTIPATTGPALEFGELQVVTPTGQIDVVAELLKSGWAKLKEPQKNADAAQEERRLQLQPYEDEAKGSGKGLWGNSGSAIDVHTQPPSNPESFLKQYKDKEVDAIVEQVLNGSTVKVRLLLSPTEHQWITVQLAGIRSPRAASLNAADTSQAEEWGNEARFFAEARLLQRNVKVTLLAIPPSAGPSAPFIGIVAHPAGSIAALLASFGFAKCVDLHAGYLGAERMSALRKAESDAKTARRGVWANVVSNGASGKGVKGYEALVTRIQGVDTILARKGKDGEGEEVKITLSSVRQPKPSDPKLGGLQVEGKEYLRKRIIGKVVHVTRDYVKPAEGQFEEKTCCTVKTANGKNIAEELVERGYLSVIKHRRDDEDKSSEIDKLIQAEQKAQNEKKGLHSGKDYPIGRTVDASETASKASTFLASFRRAGRIPAVVDFVASASRFKVFLPKQDIKITLVLLGIRAPRTARNPSEKSEPYGAEAQEYVARKVLQRDVEVEIDATDKSGGFIGTLYLNKSDNLAINLVRQGFASISDYGAERVPFAKQLQEAEGEARRARKNIWKGFDEEAERAAAPAEQASVQAARKEYVDILVSDIRADPFSFSFQILKDGSIPELETLMKDFALHHKTQAQSSTVAPRSGDLVSARFTVDQQWYRARVLRANPQKKLAQVQFIDYGNSEQLPFSELRPLEGSFKTLPAQSHTATLSLITLFGPDTDYGAESLDLFRELAEGKPLVANIDYKEPGANGTHHLTLFDPNDPSSKSENNSVNAVLVREGLARVDPKSKIAAAYPQAVASLKAAANEAHQERKGAYEFGDISDDPPH